ncbi:MAG: sigma factor-like helix-turn-helix DNA-binding protein [Candidatus Margulisbacteria bacterium]|nr:sigma factor-like helix-turn-helix DNA-binding protein [Candidatus Margulisiibacteriota bacterium]
MDKENLEKFKANLHFEEEPVYSHLWIEERWKIIQIALIKMAFHLLPPVERRILTAVYFSGLGEAEIARKLKLPKAQIIQLKMKSLKSLAKSIYVKLAMSPWRLNECRKTGQIDVENSTVKTH